MNIKLHVLNTSGKLTSFTSNIKSVSEDTIKEVKKVLPIDSIDVIVWDYPDWSIEKYGIGGHTLTPNTIVISIDSENKNLNKNFDKRLKQTIIHEIHHAARLQIMDNDKASRLEHSIREGLAEHFEIELTGKEPEVWDMALSKEDLDKFVEVAKTNLSTEDYLVYDWLFGNKELGVPKWTGYSVGFYLVGEYLKKHPNKKPSTLYATSANEFVK
ncbi:MAG: DUF2268 domain-containing putative Zn-dependent protease [Patescibacteria group bacterium]